MSYINLASTIDTIEDHSIKNDSYSCDDFLLESIAIRSDVAKEINRCAKEFNDNAISSILNESIFQNRKDLNVDMSDYVKSKWEDTREKYITSIVNTYNKVYKFINNKYTFMKENSSEINNTTLVYGDVIPDEGEKKVRSSSIKIHEKVILPYEITRITNKSTVDEKSSYKNTILGNTTKIDISDINSGRNIVVHNFDDVLKDLDKTKDDVVKLAGGTPTGKVSEKDFDEFNNRLKTYCTLFREKLSVMCDFTADSCKVIRLFISKGGN